MPPARVAGQRLAELVERFGLDVRDGVPVAQLSVGEQQRLEILRALDADASVLLLDEPTAVLTGEEATRLLAVCRRLADEGRSVVIITHRLSEVVAGCDRVTVLRDGAVVLADAAVADHTVGSLADAMVGRALGTSRTRASRHPSPPDAAVRLDVAGVSLGSCATPSFTVRAGEVLGVAGVDGNGQAELEAVLAGVEAAGRRHRHARRRGGAARLAAPTDRRRHRLHPVRPLPHGARATDEPRRQRRARPRRRGGGLAAAAGAGPTAPRLQAWNVRAAGPGAPVRSLSGGNAQKLVLARELDSSTRPRRRRATRRVASTPAPPAAVADRVLDAAAGGAAVVWMGAELEEVLAVAHRIVVLSRGRITGEFARPFDRSAIGLAMGGGRVTTSSTEPDSSCGSGTPGHSGARRTRGGMDGGRDDDVVWRSTRSSRIRSSRSSARRRPGRRTALVVGVPLVAVLAALAIGGVLIAIEGSNPFAVYGDVVRGVFFAKRGLQQHRRRPRRR